MTGLILGEIILLTLILAKRNGLTPIRTLGGAMSGEYVLS